MTAIETPAVLYHWTCSDGKGGITTDGYIRPNASPVLGATLLWLTDLKAVGAADRAVLGLTSHSLTCDRTEWRFAVATAGAGVEHWTTWAHRKRLRMEVRDLLEGAPGALPMRWWVSETAVKVDGYAAERIRP